MNTSFYQIHRNNLHRFTGLLKTNCSYMNYTIYFILFIGFCLQWSNSNAQNIDSLFLKHTDKNGKVILDSVLKAGKNILHSQPDKTFEIAQKSIALAKKQQEPMQLAYSYRQLSAYYIDIKSNYDSATYYLQQAEPIFRANRSEESINGLGGILNNYANIQLFQNNYSKALEIYLDALKLLDKTGETDTRARILNNVSFLYAFFKDYKKSEKYARECVQLAQHSNNELMTAAGSIALVDALIHQDKLEEVPVLLEDVKKYADRKKDITRTITYYYNYGSYFMRKNDYPSALQYYKMAKNVADSIGSEWEIMRTGIGIADIYSLNKQYYEALTYAVPALKIAEKFEMMDMRQRTLNIMAIANAGLGNYEKAYLQSRLAYLLKDTVLNESNRQHLAFLEVEYETEKNIIRIDALEKERLLYGIIFAVSLLGIIILLGALYFRQRAKKQLAQQQIIQLQKEQQLIATQALLEGETTERTRLARDLHDGLGSMLSVVKFSLPQMKSGVTIEQEDVSRFQKALGLLDQSIQELRRVAHHMMPETLVRFGLKTALTDFAEAIPHLNFHYFGNEERIAQKLEIMIYRSIHELVNNALKHAEATQINVQLVQETDRISFTVQDNGKGFDPENIQDGMGLKNIRQRVETFRGKMNIYSTAQGTEIHIELELTA